jgi:steroid 5-alpha reductase family enzyme
MRHMTFLEGYLSGLVVIVVIMTLFLLRVSGVMLLDKTLATTKPGYKGYVGSTSTSIPRFPRTRS